MALTIPTLSKIGGGLQQLHLYNTADAIATVLGSGYFNLVTNQLKQNDVILVVSKTGGTREFDAICVTSATDAATVTTTALEGSLDA
jgi:hypothetical protein